MKMWIIELDENQAKGMREAKYASLSMIV